MSAGTDPVRELLRWLEAVEVPRQIVLGCAAADLPPLPAAMAGIRLQGCFSQEDLGLPAQLLACGVETIRVVACGEDADDHERHLRSWMAVLPDVAPLEGRPRVGLSLSRGSVHVMGTAALPRRLALGLGRGRELPLNLDLDAASRTVEALRILRARGRAHDPDPPDGADGSGAPASAANGVELSAVGCIACGVCVRACPHAALALDHRGGTSALTHVVDACRGEQDCVALCPVGALTPGRSLSVIELADRSRQTLAQIATTVCGRCGARHTGDDGSLCEACAFRTQNPFGSMAPPFDIRASPGRMRGR
ncbi:MAG: ferredoxin family protein [Propioniciclava sp.]